MKSRRHQADAVSQVPCLILAGGLGTRLRRLLPDLPKPMAPIAGKPFMEYLLSWIRRAGFCQLIICTGYQGHQVQDHFGDGKRFGLQVTYSHETEPLGTWGAIRQAKKWILHSNFLVLNGDSWVDVDLPRLISFHQAKRALVTVALAPAKTSTRFGSVRIDTNGRVTEFVEKEIGGTATLINAGIYVFRRTIFGAAPAAASSLENEIFPALISHRVYGFPVPGFFVDIGVPEDYKCLRNSPEMWLRALGGPQ